MNQRAQYLIQILDKIGAPLLSAVDSRDDADTAQIVASLLGKVVETSISMNNALDLNANDAQDDSLRVALAALSGSLVADQYKQKGKLPEAADLARIQSALSAVLTFADNFTLSPDHVKRLSALKANGGAVDAHQINLQYVDALIPVVNAVGAFPFGQPEQKLIMDVSDRLVKRTAEMRETLLPGLSGDDEKLAELAILRATASVYAACHETETQRLTSTDAEAPEVLSIEPVWKAFESRTAMLESVAKNIMPQGAVTQAAPSAPIPPIVPPIADAAPEEPSAPPPMPPMPASETPQAPPPAAAPAAEAPQEQQKPAIFGGAPSAPPANEQAPDAPPAAPPPTVTPPPAEPQETQAAQSGGNPMGFFSKPKEGADNAAPPPPPVAPPAQPEPPPAEVPPAQQPPPVTPPPTSPPAPPPAEESTGESSDDEEKGGGSPMSFFTKKE